MLKNIQYNIENGPKVEGKASLSKIWLYAGNSDVSSATRSTPSGAVTMRGVRTISRKDFYYCRRILRDYMPDIPVWSEDIVRAVWRHTEVDSLLSNQPFSTC